MGFARSWNPFPTHWNESLSINLVFPINQEKKNSTWKFFHRYQNSLGLNRAAWFGLEYREFGSVRLFIMASTSSNDAMPKSLYWFVWYRVMEINRSVLSIFYSQGAIIKIASAAAIFSIKLDLVACIVNGYVNCCPIFRFFVRGQGEEAKRAW